MLIRRDSDGFPGCSLQSAMQQQAHLGQTDAVTHLDTALIGSFPIVAALCGDPETEADFAAGERQEGLSLGRSPQLHPEQALFHL